MAGLGRRWAQVRRRRLHGSRHRRLAARQGDSPGPSKIVVDTLAPGLRGAGVSPAAFSPNGDGSDDTAAVRYVPAEACAIRVAIVDADGKVRRRLSDWRSQSTAAHSATWDGRVTDGGKLVAAAEGDYRFLIECRDAAGNISRKSVGVALDRTLGFPTAAPETLSPNGDGANDSTTLGFTLTRSATVRIAVKVGGKTVAPSNLGSLGAGSHEVVWDGANGAGEPLDSGRPSFTVTAKSPLGATSVSRELVVDLYRPEALGADGSDRLAGQDGAADLHGAGLLQRQGRALVRDHRRRRRHGGRGVAWLGGDRQGDHLDLEAARARGLHRDVHGDRSRREPRTGARRDPDHGALAAGRSL